MAVRWLITDAAWAEIEPRLAAIKHKAGSPPDVSDRVFIEAILSPLNLSRFVEGRNGQSR